MIDSQVTVLDASKLLAGSGTPADTTNFTELVQKNMKLYELNNEIALGTKAAANYVRGELATALRKGPFQTNLLLGGYDANDSASLYFIDMYASFSKVNFGAHGYASNFLLSVFDREWTKGLSEEEAMVIIRKCINELHTRFLLSQPVFTIKLVDKNGVRVIKL
jgi:20S proteasome subunit beta 4